MANQTKLVVGSYRKYTNALHASYQRAQYNIISALPAADLQAWRLQPLLSPWKASVDVEFDISRETTSSTSTQTLETLDRKRDRIISYIFNIIKVERSCGLEQSREQAAARLGLITKTYSKLQDKGYREQTAETDGLVIDLQKAEALKDMQTLGLDTYIAQLQSVNQEFLTTLEGRTHSRAQSQLPTAKDQRKVSDDIYATLCKRIEGVFDFLDSEAEQERLNQLVVLLNKTASEYQARYNQATGQTSSSQGGSTPAVTPSSSGGGSSATQPDKADGE